MFDGIVLKITGTDVSYGSPTENPINDVKLTAGTVTDWSVDIQSPGFGENTWPNVWWSTYYRPHTYSITFIDDTHVKVVDEDTGEEIKFSDQRAEGYAILTGTGWRDEYVRADTPDFFRIYIRGRYVYIRDPNQEIDAGDVFTVEMGGVSAPRDGDEFLLTTKEETLDAENIEADLGKIRVVPNPYFVTNRAVTSEGMDKIFFTRLPPRCTIRVYTLAGELVRTIEHESDASYHPDVAPDNRSLQGDKGGTASFELLNRYNQALASGIYIYHVEARDESDTVVGNKIGRFAIIR